MWMRYLPKAFRRRLVRWAKSISYRTLIGPHDQRIYTEAKESTDTLAANDLYPLVPAVYAGIYAISAALASVPMRVIVGDEPAGEDHPLSKLLARPNNFDTSYDLMEATGINMEVTGEAYWLMEGTNGPVGEGETPVTLTPLHPNHVTPILDKKDKISGFQYDVQGRISKFKRDSMLFFSFYDPSDPLSVRGLASARPASAAATLDVIAQNFNRGFFKRGATLSGVLESDNEDIDQDTMDTILAKFRQDFGSSENAWKVKGMSHGFKYKPIQPTHTDMLFEKMREQNRGEILMSLGVPPVMVTDLSGSTYANAQEQRRQFWETTILPKIRKLEARLNRDLASRYGPNVRIQFDLSGIRALQPDIAKITEAGRKMIEVASLAPNEFRQWASSGILPDLPPLPGGDKPLISFGLTSVDIAFSEEGSGHEEDEEGSDHEPDIEDSINRLISLVEKGEVDSVKKQFASRQERLRRASETIFTKTTEKMFRDQARVVSRFFEVRGDRFEAFQGMKRPKASSRFKAATDELLQELRDLEEGFVKEYQGVYSGTTQRSGELAMSLIPGALIYVAATAASISFAVREATELVRNLTETTTKKIRNTLSEGIIAGESNQELQARASQALGPSTTNSRAQTTGVSESNKSVNFGALDAWGQTNGLVQRKTWATVGDDDVRESHEDADGLTVGINDLFQVGFSLLEYPGDTSNGAGTEEIANCRCSMFPQLVQRSLGETNGRLRTSQA